MITAIRSMSTYKVIKINGKSKTRTLDFDLTAMIDVELNLKHSHHPGLNPRDLFGSLFVFDSICILRLQYVQIIENASCMTCELNIDQLITCELCLFNL